MNKNSSEPSRHPENPKMSAEDHNVNSNSRGNDSSDTSRATMAPGVLQEPYSRQPDSPAPTATSTGPPADGEIGRSAGSADSPPARKDTMSSTSTASSASHAASHAASQSDATVTNATASEPPVSPTQGQSIFSVKDGAEVSGAKRASRRRTGPLSQQQREKAALIRKLGACTDCRRRRVACHPNHHNMTWEDALRKFRSASPTTQEIAPLTRPLSPAPSHLNHSLRHDVGDDMEIDSSPIVPATRPGVNRTPLPSGPSGKRPSSSTSIVEPIQTDLQNAASKIARSQYRSRYSHASALLLCWNGDECGDVYRAVEELGKVLQRDYNYQTKICTIPQIEGNLWRFVMNQISEFIGHQDQRDSLKLVYYNGYSFLDANREMVLASSFDKDTASTVRWSGIQQVLEEACSDTCVLMDSPYYPSAKTVRQKGVLEFISAAGSAEHAALLGRTKFTKTVTRLLQGRASQMYASPFTAAELHSKLLSEYPAMIGDPSPDKAILSSYPVPLHVQVADNVKHPSILLAPIQPAPQRSSIGTEPQLTLTFKLSESSNFNFDTWVEWLRTMPEDVKDVRVDGPTRLR